MITKHIFCPYCGSITTPKVHLHYFGENTYSVECEYCGRFFELTIIIKKSKKQKRLLK